MVKGFSISYKLRDAIARTQFHQKLFGRISHRSYRGREYVYYSPGILDNKRFTRLIASKIFVLDLDGINVDLLNVFGDITIEPCERDDSQLVLKTGREYWKDIAVERNLVLRDYMSTKRKGPPSRDKEIMK